ncbi:MAG TPA: hypothetical protein DCS93_27160 [Microscillaceae bacterium]|nr:hypothetical protein [Microscillaceae bacterium]
MEAQNIQKIIALLESEDEKNIPIGLRLMESLRLTSEVFIALHGNNSLPTSICQDATSKVTLYFENQQISLQSRKTYLEFYDKLSNLMRTFSDKIVLSQRIFNLINTGFFIFAGQLVPQEHSMLQILSHSIHHYVLFGLKTSWATALNFHKHIKALVIEQPHQINLNSLIRWRDLASFCQAPLHYQLTPQSDSLVHFDLLLKIK